MYVKIHIFSISHVFFCLFVSFNQNSWREAITKVRTKKKNGFNLIFQSIFFPNDGEKYIYKVANISLKKDPYFFSRFFLSSCCFFASRTAGGGGG
jgi:hypothetical protein